MIPVATPESVGSPESQKDLADLSRSLQDLLESHPEAKLPDIRDYDLGFKLPDIRDYDLGFKLPDISDEVLGITRTDKRSAVDASDAEPDTTSMDRTIALRDDAKTTSSETSGLRILPHPTELNTAEKQTAFKGEARKPRRLLKTAEVIGVFLVAGIATMALSKGNTGEASLHPSTTTTELPSSTTEATTSTSLSTTTTTEQYKPYTTQTVESALDSAGRLIPPAFKVGFPDACEGDIFVYQIDKNRVDQIGEARDATPADVMVSDPTPLENGCVQVDEYGNTHPKFISRAERHRKEYNFDGEDTKASKFQPIAVHLNDNMYPGEEGIFVVMGHGSTKNAAFADVASLKIGSLMTVTRDDGKEYVYRYVAQKTYTVPKPVDHSPAAVARRKEVTDEIWGYKNPESTALAAVIRCGDEEGNPGSDAARVVDYYVLVGEVKGSAGLMTGATTGPDGATRQWHSAG